jgi:hypothetical protein
MKKMLEAKPVELRGPEPEGPMIKIKHRWKRNKSDMCGSIVLGFDEKGIALVEDRGNNRAEVDTYVRFSKGLASVVVDDEVPVHEPEVAKPAPEPEVVKPAPEPEVVLPGTMKTEVVEAMVAEPPTPTADPEEEVMTSTEEPLADEDHAVRVARPIKKKTPPKKKPTKKK